MNSIQMLPINNKFPQNIFKKSLSNILDTSSIKTTLPIISPNTLNTNTYANADKQKTIPKENSIGYNINSIFEPVCITLDGTITCTGSITLDIGVWIINYGINFTTGSGDTNGANIYRIQYGISDNQENIPLTNKTDISKLCVVTFQKPYFENGSVFIATNHSEYSELHL